MKIIIHLVEINTILNIFRIGAVTRIFSRYMDLVRKLQITYRMEPAGSHGVWSLDDFQFIPFILGSSQFVGTFQFNSERKFGLILIYYNSANDNKVKIGNNFIFYFLYRKSSY